MVAHTLCIGGGQAMSCWRLMVDFRFKLHQVVTVCISGDDYNEEKL